MSRVPDEQIERLKQEVFLDRLVEGMGIALKRHGAELLGLCPFHDDHEPSRVISSKSNLGHCLGACQTGGSVIDWVMKAEGVSFRHAVGLLQAGYAPSALAAGPVKCSTVPTRLESAKEVDSHRSASQGHAGRRQRRTVTAAFAHRSGLCRRLVAWTLAIIRSMAMRYVSRPIGDVVVPGMCGVAPALLYGPGIELRRLSR